MDIHKTLYPPYITATVKKLALYWCNNASLLLLLFTQCKTTWLTAISSRFLTALPAIDIRVSCRMRHNA